MLGFFFFFNREAAVGLPGNGAHREGEKKYKE